MTDAESHEALKHVDDICRKALNKYIENPWQWPREMDLAGWFQQTLLQRLDQGKEGVKAEEDPPKVKGKGRFKRKNLRCPRVRLECKVGSKSDRIDLVVIKKNEPKLHFNNEGLRDVNLTMAPQDLLFLLEFKLYPDVHGSSSPWFDDIEKLHKYKGQKVSRGVVMFDTSLPLPERGIYEEETQWAKNRLADNTGAKSTDRPKWPLPREEFKHGEYTFSPIEPNDMKPEELYLWALSSVTSVSQLLDKTPKPKPCPTCWHVTK
jgi:hypothetical protein